MVHKENLDQMVAWAQPAVLGLQGRPEIWVRKAFEAVRELEVL